MRLIPSQARNGDLINDALQEALKRHYPWVFANQEGKPYNNVRKALHSATQVAGIEHGVGLHQLRHAFCSHGLMKGVDPRTMQQRMGHRSLATTLKYAHVSSDHEKTAIQRLQCNTWHQDGASDQGNMKKAPANEACRFFASALVSKRYDWCAH